MPFDFMVLSKTRTLAQAADDLGLRPIPLEELAAHMLHEQAKYPPNFWHRHRLASNQVAMVCAIVGLILTVGIVAMAVAGSRSTDQRDVATASMTRASAVKRVAPVF